MQELILLEYKIFTSHHQISPTGETDGMWHAKLHEEIIWASLKLRGDTVASLKP
jgi:hypothetical protein